MSLTINTRVFTIDDASSKGTVIYRDPSATAALPSTVLLGRADPVPNASFNGVSKGEFRLNRMTAVGEKNWPLVLRASSSFPVGANEAAVDLGIADFRSFVASQAFEDLVKGGKIYHG